MTNWQRTQWAKIGYKKDPDSLRRFTELMHWKRVRLCIGFFGVYGG